MDSLAYSLGLFLFTLPLHLLNSFGYYGLFKKAGKNGLLAFIPFYNAITQMEIIGRKWYEVFYQFIPFVGVFFFIRDEVDFLKVFGEERSWHKTLAITFGWLYFPLMSTRKGLKYLGQLKDLPQKEKSKSVVREWIDAVAFAVVAATLIRWLIMEAYTIPTPSMENSLLVGDFLFVSKFHYGTRTPKTPLQLPLTHQKIWFTEIPSYIDWIQLPQYRLPGISRVKRNDVVVFNVPGIEENNLYAPKSEWIDYPVDLKTNYIKRCVAIAGDTIEVRDHQVFINSAPGDNPPYMQLDYSVYAKSQINDRVLNKFDIDEFRITGHRENQVRYAMPLTSEVAEELRKLPFIDSLVLETRKDTEFNIFPNAEKFPWSGDFFGPIVLPKEGMTIEVNATTLALYGKMILRYEHHKDVKVENDKLFIDGKEVSSYTFIQNYYFMMGDNRHNSLDSRYWGFVPEDHIVGKGFFIWLSIDRNASFFNKIRWRRFFNLIR